MKQSIAIFKNNKEGKSENYPGYRVVVSEQQPDGTYKKMSIANLWADAKAPEGHPILKGELSGEYTKTDGTKVHGFKVVENRPENTPLPEVDTRDHSNGDPDDIEINF